MLKKCVISIFCVLIFFSSVKVSGSQNITAFYNDSEITFDTSPFIEENRVLVPIRAITEKFGAEVKYFFSLEAKTVIISLTNIKAELAIDSKKAIVNGQSVDLDVAPKIVNDRTYLPLRFISETFEKKVFWSDADRMINIYSSDKVPFETPNVTADTDWIYALSEEKFTEMYFDGIEYSKYSDMEIVAFADVLFKYTLGEWGENYKEALAKREAEMNILLEEYAMLAEEYEDMTGEKLEFKDMKFDFGDHILNGAHYNANSFGDGTPPLALNIRILAENPHYYLFEDVEFNKKIAKVYDGKFGRYLKFEIDDYNLFVVVPHDEKLKEGSSYIFICCIHDAESNTLIGSCLGWFHDFI